MPRPLLLLNLTLLPLLAAFVSYQLETARNSGTALSYLHVEAPVLLLLLSNIIGAYFLKRRPGYYWLATAFLGFALSCVLTVVYGFVIIISLLLLLPGKIGG